MSKIDDLRLELERTQAQLSKLHGEGFAADRERKKAQSKKAKADEKVSNAFDKWMAASRNRNYLTALLHDTAEKSHNITKAKCPLYTCVAQIKKELEDAIEEDTTNLNNL